MGWGALMRDHHGSFMMACNEGIAGIVAPELAEAMAARRALEVSRDNGFRCISMASDCLTLIQRIRSSSMDRSLVGSVVGDIKRLASEFDICSFKHVGRSSNVMAHVLARRSMLSSCNFYFDVVPECLREELCNDVI
ncbi:hypothetical protein ZWY2020_035087 [Hordeum vulgare]|nr:hypothetical protein ZWY2020_035087 [Hordeum vulgare]